MFREILKKGLSLKTKPRFLILIFLFIFPLVCDSYENLYKLNNRNDRNRKRKRYGILGDVKLCQAERTGKEGNFNNHGGQNEREQRRTPQPKVLLFKPED